MQLKLNEIVKSARLGKEMTQKQAAKELNITPQYYHDIETGRRAPTFYKTVRKLSQFTGLSERDILYLAVFRKEIK